MRINNNLLIFSIFIVCMTFLNKVSAQPNIEWEKSYGGSDWEQTVTIEQTIDNSYLAVLLLMMET